MNRIEKVLSTAIALAVAVSIWVNVSHRFNDFEKARQAAVTYSMQESKRADSLLALANQSESRSDSLTVQLAGLNATVTAQRAQIEKARQKVFKPDGSFALPDTCLPALQLIQGQTRLIDTLSKTVAVQEARHGEDSLTVVNLHGALSIQTKRADSLTTWVRNIKVPGECSWLGLPCPSRKASVVIGIIGMATIYSRHSIPFIHVP